MFDGFPRNAGGSLPYDLIHNTLREYLTCIEAFSDFSVRTFSLGRVIRGLSVI